MVRGVLYTAITRARELLVLVGDDVVPGKMAENDRQQRITHLSFVVKGRGTAAVSPLCCGMFAGNGQDGGTGRA